MQILMSWLMAHLD